jgi:hypothetical protein
VSSFELSVASGHRSQGVTMPDIRIIAGPVTVLAALGGAPTARAIRAALPISGRASTWGEEIYFAIPVDADVEPGASAVVALGDIAYWPPGSALCLFFGPTPASHGNEIRAASAVNVVGRVEGDATVLRQVRDGTPIRVELIDPTDP